MPLPASSDARLFYRSAFQRFEESVYRQKGEYRTAAVYLAGYAVECILKALILSQASSVQRRIALKSFKGSHAHDFGWLKGRYLKLSGSAFPAEVERQFINVATWTTNLALPGRNLEKAGKRCLFESCQGHFGLGGRESLR